LATGIPARLTAAEGRKFGLTVGIAFLVLGGISAWRGHTLAPRVFWALGGALSLSGLVVPTLLGPVQRGWMGLAHQLSRVTTPIALGIVYFLVFTPAGWLRRKLGQNPLEHSAGATGYWKVREGPSRRSDLTRQF